MFERFTDRFRRVMDLAGEKARHCGRHNVDVEHILLGLVEEGGGVGATALERLGANLFALRGEIEKHLGAQGGSVVEGKLYSSPRAHLLIERAVNEARLMGCNYVGTEHLLLGLASETSPVVLAILASLGVDRSRIRAEVLSLLGRDEESAACEASRPDGSLAAGPRDPGGSQAEAGVAEEADPLADDSAVKLAEALFSELAKRKQRAAADHDYDQAGAYRDLAVIAFDLKKRLRAVLDLWGRAQND